MTSIEEKLTIETVPENWKELLRIKYGFQEEETKKEVILLFFFHPLECIKIKIVFCCFHLILTKILNMLGPNNYCFFLNNNGL